MNWIKEMNENDCCIQKTKVFTLLDINQKC